MANINRHQIERIEEAPDLVEEYILVSDPGNAGVLRYMSKTDFVIMLQGAGLAGGGSQFQTLSLVSEDLTISGGNTVDLSSINTQTLGLGGNILSISGGNSVDLANMLIPASQVTVTDAGGYYTGGEVETILQEIGPNIHAAVTLAGGSSWYPCTCWS